MVGGEQSLKSSGLQLLWFGIDSVLKILNKSMTDRIIYSVIKLYVEESDYTWSVNIDIFFKVLQQPFDSSFPEQEEYN